MTEQYKCYSKTFLKFLIFLLLNYIHRISLVMGSPQLRTPNSGINFDDAVQEEHNMLVELSYPDKQRRFWRYLRQNKAEIERLISSHLSLRTSDCQLTSPREWKQGSFNVCLPALISNWNQHIAKKVIIRFPLPYKLGEAGYPGNTDEKLRCKAATYLWIQENCPEVPILSLWGFGFSYSQRVSR